MINLSLRALVHKALVHRVQKQYNTVRTHSKGRELTRCLRIFFTVNATLHELPLRWVIPALESKNPGRSGVKDAHPCTGPESIYRVSGNAKHGMLVLVGCGLRVNPTCTVNGNEYMHEETVHSCPKNLNIANTLSLSCGVQFGVTDPARYLMPGLRACNNTS